MQGLLVSAVPGLRGRLICRVALVSDAGATRPLVPTPSTGEAPTYR